MRTSTSVCLWRPGCGERLTEDCIWTFVISRDSATPTLPSSMLEEVCICPCTPTYLATVLGSKLPRRILSWFPVRAHRAQTQDANRRFTLTTKHKKKGRLILWRDVWQELSEHFKAELKMGLGTSRPSLWRSTQHGGSRTALHRGKCSKIKWKELRRGSTAY